jgi:choline kinase
MGKRSKKKGASTYKPASAMQSASKVISKATSTQQSQSGASQKPNHIPSKAARLLEDQNNKKSDVFKNELQVSGEMFEAAKLMKSGVAHIKDLDMSVLKQVKSKQDATYTCKVTMIDIMTGSITMDSQVMDLDKDATDFDFNDEDDFNADADCVDVAKKAWDWLLNPIGIDRFKKEVKDKKIMVI